MLLIGYFEGISSQRGIAWRFHGSLSLKTFLGLEVTDSAPDHSSLDLYSQTPAAGGSPPGHPVRIEDRRKEETFEGKNDRDGRHHAGSQFGDEVDRSQ